MENEPKGINPLQRANSGKDFCTLPGILVSIFLLLAVTAFILAYYRGSSMIKAFLEAKVKDQTKGLYTLQMKDLNLILFPGRLRIEGLSLVPDTARYRELQRTDTIVNSTVDPPYR